MSLLQELIMSTYKRVSLYIDVYLYWEVSQRAAISLYIVHITPWKVELKRCAI